MPFDHFRLLAPYYDRMLGPPDAAHLAALLKLPTPGWMLDGGGGTGRVSACLRALVGRVVVSDVSERMLAAAAAKRLFAVRSRAERLPFADGAFDRILVVDALHHFDDQAAAIGDFERVLKPGGRMLIEEFNIDRAVVRLIAWAERAAVMRSRFLGPDRIRRMLVGRGLRVQVRTRRLSAWLLADKL
jgi:demethylmenaquinone methyltransferase/2-methoxy-6-polyprenyl-1,4-benzoquinol methylase